MKIPKPKDGDWIILLYLAGIFLWVYVFVRAAVLSFTHDESLTYTILKGDKTWVLTANNHVLNSILAKGSALIFGYSELGLRLPNVLAFAAYLYFLTKLIRQFKLPWLLLACAILFFNPYLLDFFSLARGYGLALGCSAANLYFWSKVFEKGDQSHISWALLTGTLATYSNYSFFTFFFATSCAGLFFHLKTQHFRLQKRLLVDLAGGFLLLLPALWHVKQLVERNELYFGGDKELMEDTLRTLAIKFLYEIPADLSGLSLQIISVLLLAALLVGGYLFLIKKRMNLLFRFIYLAFLLSLLLPVLLFHFFNVKYPIERAAIYYLLLFGLFIPSFLQATLDEVLKKWVSILFAVCVVGLSIYPFVKGINLSYTNDWKYDANTEKMLENLEKAVVKDKTTLGVNPLFEPTVNYYRETKGYSWLEKATRENIRSGSFDFVYCRLDEREQLPHNVLVESFPVTGTCLVSVTK